MADDESALFFGTESDLNLLYTVCCDPYLLNGKIPIKEGNGLLAVCKALAAHNAMEEKMHISLMGRNGGERETRTIRALVFDLGGAEIPNKNAVTILWCSKAPQALASSKRELQADVAKRQAEIDGRTGSQIVIGEGYAAKSAGCCFVHIEGDKKKVVAGVDGQILQLLWLAKETLPADEVMVEDLGGKFFLQPLSDTEPLASNDCAAFKRDAFHDSSQFARWLELFGATIQGVGKLKDTIAKLLRPKDVENPCLWNICDTISESNKQQYRNSNLEIFMPDFADLEKVFSYDRPSVRFFEPRFDLYMWKKGGCVKPNLEISDWHAQMAVDLKDKEDKEKKAQEDREAKAEKKKAEKAEADKKKAMEEAEKKAEADKKKEEKAEAERKKVEKAKKEADAKKKEQDAKKKAVADAKKADADAKKEAKKVEATIQSLSNPPAIPKESSMKEPVMSEEKSLLYSMKQTNKDLAAKVIDEERLTELIAQTLESLHSCVERGFGTKKRPKKGAVDVQDSLERLKTHGFFESGEVSEAAWKKVFPSFWEEEEEEEEEKGEEAKEAEEVKEVETEGLVEDEEEEEEPKMFAPNMTVSQLRKTEEKEKKVTKETKKETGSKPELKLVKKTETKKEMKAKKKTKEPLEIDDQGRQKYESEKYPGYFYWFDPQTKEKMWCTAEEDEEEEDEDSSDSDESALGEPPPAKKKRQEAPQVMMVGPMAMPNQGPMVMPNQFGFQNPMNQGQMTMPTQGPMMMPNQFGFQQTTGMQGQMMMPNPGQMMQGPMVMPNQFGFQNPMNQGQMMMPTQGQMMMPNQGQMMMPNQGQMMPNQGQMMLMPQGVQSFGSFTVQDATRRRRKKKK